jgi:hypothetical protein
MIQYIVILGAVVSLSGIILYIKKILRGETKPNRISWLMWSIAPLIATFAGLEAGVRWAVLPVFMSGFGPLLVLIFSFASPKSYWKLELFDYLCGFFSCLALILWAITKQPLVAIIFAVASDASAAIPTLIKGWRHPESESIGPFLGGLFSALTSFFAIKYWTASAYVFPFYLIAINFSLIFAITFKKIFKAGFTK